jgi:hypothetical protein
MANTTPVTALSFAKLEMARRRLESWRKTRRSRSRIPEHFWASFVELVREYGLYKTARTLRLDYACLKKRFESAARGSLRVQEPPPAFIELMPSSPVSCSECIVELEHPKGTKMRIHLKTGTPPDLAAISTTFWTHLR